MHRGTFLVFAGTAAFAQFARNRSGTPLSARICNAVVAKITRSTCAAMAIPWTLWPRHDLDAITLKHQIPEALSGCHTTLIGGYVVEGHVPVPIIERLLRERSARRGISLPGMPAGSPGMIGSKREPFKIYEIATRPSPKPALYAVD